MLEKLGYDRERGRRNEREAKREGDEKRGRRKERMPIDSERKERRNDRDRRKMRG